MKQHKRHSGFQKDKMGIITASVFVLSALTLTGVYFASGEDTQEENNKIDFAKIEENRNEKEERATKEVVEENRDISVAGDIRPRYEQDIVNNSDLDIDPFFSENENIVASEEPIEGELMKEEEQKDSKVVVYTPHFEEDEALQWPIVGEILLDYSMDHAIYFKTMQQYKYNPSMVIAANEGDELTAAADAIVKKVGYDSQIGNNIVFDLGDGYELTYGQLSDIAVKEGDIVNAGDVVGKIAQPTIYYTEEGCNAYIMLTQDGVPIDPMSQIVE